MKRKRIFTALALVLFLSGCVVYSFYPLYTEKDLFPNDILKGEWYETDNAKFNDAQDAKSDDSKDVWNFVHPWKDKENEILDSCGYVLTLHSKEEGKEITSTFLVHVVRLGEQYFLDFYLKDYPDDSEFQLSSFHLIPVHTIARLDVEENALRIRWIDPGWLAKLIRENKIRIRHEENDKLILLTAKPRELQKFVTKYVHSEEAFKDGLEILLARK